ncbi:MAG: glycosyltransferase N-terminal domain-containing protein [Pseudomonadota bacterium]
MRIGLFLYRLATRLLAPAVSLMARGRVTKGKENPDTLHARFAKGLPPKPDGPLVWLHGASVGESKLCLLIGDALREERPNLTLLHTCQTLTGAALILAHIAGKPNRIYAPAPIDTPAIARRFSAHWQPDLAIFAEGEIWPNLLCEVRERDAKTALINARMTKGSLEGWSRWPDTARTVLGRFDLIAASDADTAKALQTHAPHAYALPANLKTDLPPPTADEDEVASLKTAIGGRPVLLAASTHPGEEALVLDALSGITRRPFLILAPRHPERGNDVQNLLNTRQHTVSRRSKNAPITRNTDVLLADTMGEMGLWIRLADTVYLGGGHAEGVGGHNPLEPIRLGKPVLTGANVFNFSAMMEELENQGALTFVETASELADAFPAPAPPVLKPSNTSPLAVLIPQLLALLPPQEDSHA